jgi:hypothetical protein
VRKKEGEARLKTYDRWSSRAWLNKCVRKREEGVQDNSSSIHWGQGSPILGEE